MAELMIIDNEPYPDQVWYVADPETAEPPSPVENSRFAGPWPGAWQRIDHGLCWVSVGAVTEVDDHLQGPAVYAMTSYTVTFHKHLPPELVKRLRNGYVALGIECSARTVRIVFHRLGGSPTIMYKADRVRPDEYALTVPANYTTTGLGSPFTVRAANGLRNVAGHIVGAPARDGLRAT